MNQNLQVCVCEKVKNVYASAQVLVRYMMKRARTFDVKDFAIFKICAICFGAWIAARFTKFAKRFQSIFFIGFLVGCIYLLWRIFFNMEDG